jgi:hypothetical protein
MSSSNRVAQAPRASTPNPNKGLTKPGVVVIQTFFIGLVTAFELFVRKGTGAFTGIAICLATLATIRFARLGTEYVSAATAPLAFASVALISLFAIDGLHPSRLGLDIVSSLASAAPYLLFSATVGWINFLRSRRK